MADPVTLSYIAISVAAASGVMQARQASAAGSVAKAESKIAANAEGDAARQREIERKRTLMRALSSQAATAGAAGVEFSGSLEAMARSDIQDAATDLLTDRANTAARRRGLLEQGANAQRAGRFQAGVTLLDTAGSMAQIGMAPKAKTPTDLKVGTVT